MEGCSDAADRLILAPAYYSLFAMKDTSAAWGLISLFGSVLAGIPLVMYPPGSWRWLCGLLICIVGLGVGIWLLLVPTLVAFVRNGLAQHRLRWPIERKRGWPHVVPLAGRIHHVRSLVDFRSLESERNFQITLKLLNSSAYNLQIESVIGYTKHDGIGGSQPLDIAWRAGSNSVGPLSEFDVVFDQRLPSEAVPLVAAIFREGKFLSVILHDVHVMVRAAETGERTEAKLWDGITCVISPHPVVIGVTVTATASVNVGWSGSRIEP
jgi:hypothetical protein